MEQQTLNKTPAAPGAGQRDAQGGQRAPDAAQRAAQQNYLKSLRGGPVEQQAPGAAAPPPGAGVGAGAPGALVPQGPQGVEPAKKEGFWARAAKAARGAAHWVGDKAAQAKDATVAAYHSTTQAVGNAWDKTKQVAGDVYDVAKNSSLGYANGKVSGKTNVAEVNDLMPKQYRDAMTFDKSAKNEVAVDYDVKTGIVTARAASLTLSKLAMGPLAAGPTTLTDVVITLNRDNKAAAAKGAGAAEGAKLDNIHATIHVGGVLATQVSYHGPNGLLKATQVQLSGLDASAFNPGGGMPMTDETKDHMVGTFALEKATVRGLSGEAASAKEISTSNVKGGIDQDAGTAHAEMGSAQVEQGRFGKRTVEQAALRDARIGVHGKAGNLPGLENAQAPLKFDAQVGHAEVKGAKAPEGSARAASIDGLSGQFDMATQNGNASLASARLQGAEVAGTKIKEAQLTNLAAAREGSQLTGSLEQASMTGLQSKAGSASAASLHGAKASYDTQSGDATLGLKSARADGLKSGKNGAQSVAVSGLAAERKGESVSADVASADLRGVKAGGAGGDLKATGLHGNATIGEKRTLSARAATLDGQNLHGGNASAKTAHVEGAQVGLDAKGAMSGGVKSAQATGLKVGDATAESAQVAQMAARRGADGSMSGSLESAQAKGVSAAGEKVDAVSLQGLSANRDSAGGTTAALTSARATGITGDKLNAKSLGVDGVAGTVSGSEGSFTADRVQGEAIKTGTVSADKADFQKVALAGRSNGQGTVSTAQGQVDGLAVGDAFKAKSVSAGQLAVGHDAKGYTARADTLKGETIHSGTNDVGKLDAKGVDTGFGGANGKARIDAKSIGVEQARFGDVSMQSGRAEGAGLGVAANGTVSTRADALHAETVKTPNFNAAQVDAHGVATKQTDKLTDLRAGDVSVRKGAVQAGGFQGSADEAHIQQGHAVVGRNGSLEAEVGKVGGRGIAFESAPDAKATTPAGPVAATLGDRTAGPAPGTQTSAPTPSTQAATSPGLTQGALVRGLSQRVDEVDAKFSAPMRPTTEGAVTVDPGTRMNAEVHARDNKLVPGQTGVKFSKELDGPAWIGVKGVNLEADKKSARGGKPPTQGRVEADLAGLWDQDVTDKANEALGRKDKDTIPLSISELGDLAGKKMDKDAQAAAATVPAPASPQSARRESGRTSNRQTPAAAAQTTAAQPGPLDLDQAELDARVKLSAGRVPLGGRQHVDLAQAGPGGNTVNIRARGGEDMVVDMAQVVLGSLNVQTGQKKVKAQGAQVDDAKVQVGTGKNAGKFKGTIGAFETEGVAVD